MRVLGRLLLLGLLLVIAGIEGPRLVRELRTQVQHYLGGAVDQRESDPGVTYLLPATHALEFPLRPGQAVVRVVTTANIEAAGHPRPDESTIDNLGYVIEYTLLDAAGKELRRQDYHLRSHLTWYRDETGVPYTASSYLDAALLPLDSESFVVNVAEAREARVLRLKIIEQSPAIRDVVVRCYQRERVADYRLQHLWQRLSRPQREKLARGSLYGAGQLREAERYNLLRNAWQASAPNGVAGKAYTSRILYTREENNDPVVADAPAADGLPIGPAQTGVVPLPGAGGHLRLRWAWPKEVSAGASASLTWYGNDGAPPSRTTLPIAGSSTVYEGDFAGGLLALDASSSGLVRIWRMDGETATEITPPPQILKTYPLRAQAKLEYRVSHVGDTPTPLRLDLRALAQTTETGPFTLLVRCELLGRDGEILATELLQGERPASPYERATGSAGEQVVSEVLSAYFELPAEVATLRLTLPTAASTASLANVYTRPLDLLREIRVPEDRDLQVDEVDRVPTWFSMQPVDSAATAGDYDWTDFVPVTEPPGREVIAPREANSVARPQQLTTNFRPLARNRPQTITLMTDAGTASVAPTLLWFDVAPVATALEIEIDGESLMRTSLAGSRGELQLPALPTGVHRLTLHTRATGAFYLNQVWPGPGDRLRRVVYRFADRPLSYDYDRNTPDDETLSARIYAPAGYTGRIRLRVTLSGPVSRSYQSSPEWSPRDRRYDILPDQRQQTPVLNTASELVDAGRAFFIPLRAGSPPGRYRITVTREEGPPGYLLMAKLTPGQFERRSLQRETETRHVELVE